VECDVVLATGVTHQYRAGGRNVDALRGLTLSVPRGSWTMLVGRSGAGKSTLLGLLSGQIEWYGTGEISLEGKSLRVLDGSSRARMLFQVRQDPLTSTAPDLTVAEHLVLADSCPESRQKSWIHRARDTCFPLRSAHTGSFSSLLREHGLAEYLDAPVAELSGGERQLLVLLLAHLRRVPFLILDEPLSNVDDVHARRCLEVLHRLNQAGTTILMVTHDLHVACAHGDRLACVGAGRTLAEFAGAAKNELAPSRLWELMETAEINISSARGAVDA